MLNNFDYGDIVFNITDGVDETVNITSDITHKIDITFNKTEGIHKI